MSLRLEHISVLIAFLFLVYVAMPDLLDWVKP